MHKVRDSTHLKVDLYPREVVRIGVALESHKLSRGHFLIMASTHGC